MGVCPSGISQLSKRLACVPHKSLEICEARRLKAAKQALPRLFSGPFSNRGFEQKILNFYFKKCSTIDRRRRSIVLLQPASLANL